MQRRTVLSLIFIFAAMLCAGSVYGDSVSDATSRIKQRLAQIDEMKAAGEVGEDASGYLAERQSLSGRKASIVTAENADRKIIYESIASRTGQTVAEVGEQRALQIASRAHSGVWLQKPSGEWFKKP